MAKAFFLAGMLGLLVILSQLVSLSIGTTDITLSEIQTRRQKNVLLSFTNSTTRTIGLTPGLSYILECTVSSGGNIHGSPPWTKQSGGTIIERSSLNEPESSIVYYYPEANFKRLLIFKNYNNSMNDNYTCTTSAQTYSILIKEDALTVVFPYLSRTRVHGTTGYISFGVFLAGNPQPSLSNNLTWYFNEELLNLQQVIWLPGSNFFRISNFDRQLEGNYKAVVSTSAGSSSATFYLNIESRTSACIITSTGCIEQTELVVPTGASLTINCTDTVGDPLPQFSWIKDSYNLTSANDSFTVFEPSHRMVSLTITNIQSGMAGTYTCRANNRIGKSTADIIIRVEFSPQISPITSLSYAVPIDQPIQLLIDFKGGYPPPTAVWYKLVNGMEEQLDSRATQWGINNLNLTIYNTTLEDDSLYVLYVNNSVGPVVKEVFNVTVLVPPLITSISPMVTHYPVNHCGIFLVNISGAKPPVVAADLVWSGNYLSNQVTESFINGVSNLTICGLRTSDTGHVRLKVNHSSSNKLEAVFSLTIWNPPSAPSRLSAVGRPAQSCLLYLSWYVNPPPDSNTAMIDQVIIEERHCRINTTCTILKWSQIGIFAAAINSTSIHLLPDQLYMFRATSKNNLIGLGNNVVSLQPISSEVKGYEPRVGSLTLSSITSHSLNLTWAIPTTSSNCYNLSTYDVQCNKTSTNKRIVTKTIYHSNITSNTLWTLISNLSPDTSYTCTVDTSVSDYNGTITRLSSRPPLVQSNTVPLPPIRPPLPTVPAQNTVPNTIRLSLESFKATLSSTVSRVRVAVLRLGTSPTLPHYTPDSISEDAFRTYQDVHNDRIRHPYPPYFAAEFEVSEIPSDFYIGSETSTSKRQASFFNGPLDSNDHYTLFLRVYSQSNFGIQYQVFNSTNFIEPVKPVSMQVTETPSLQGGGGGAVGAAVGVVIVLLLVIIVGIVVAIVVVFLIFKKKKTKSTDLRPTTNNDYELRNGQAPPEKPPPARSPPNMSPPPIPVLAATNPGYDKLEPTNSIYDKPSLSPDPIETTSTTICQEEHSECSSYSGSITEFLSKDEWVGSNGTTTPPPPPEFKIRPMRHVLRDMFQGYLKDLDSNEQHEFKKQFKAISDSSPNHPAVASLEEYNFVSGKNRYKDVVAFDHSRVRLQVKAGVPHSDYINANFIKGYHDTKVYIATQGPKEETHIDFWRMIWEQGTVTIVMLTNLIENAKSKCYQYWPTEGQATYGHIVVRVDRNIILPHYTIRGFKVFHTSSLDKERTVLQFHYTAWPDRNVPSQASPVLDFLRAVNSANDKSEYGPMVVHCSAGVGRTGTIIALDIALEQLKSEGKVDVEGIVTFLRHQRKQMVQVPRQYIFIHHAILEDIIYGDSSIVLSSFKDHYSRLQESDGTLIHDEFNKIGTVKPPAQACSGPNVVHQIIENKDDEDFVAHYLDGYWKPNLFIASPCPTSQNIERFWRMVWKEKCTHIIDLSPKDSETYSYVPGFSNEIVVGSMRVKASRKEYKTGYVSRHICITSEGETTELIVNHIEYQDWQIKFLPRADKFIRFVQGCLMEIEKPDRGDHPILIHDDGSNGPLGAFATLAYSFQRAKKERLIDLLQAVNLHHLQCPGLIINLQFYAYCYDCLHEYTEKLLKEESVPQIYENIASIRGRIQSNSQMDEIHHEVEGMGYEIL